MVGSQLSVLLRHSLSTTGLVALSCVNCPLSKAPMTLTPLSFKSLILSFLSYLFHLLAECNGASRALVYQPPGDTIDTEKYNSLAGQGECSSCSKVLRIMKKKEVDFATNPRLVALFYLTLKTQKKLQADVQIYL